ncbi:hypothetical protein RI129_002117 [Pyrocoelia pectoralis]|uniref:Uncharacterized protein n=1 Tax=Pyrocoelia pectoralis TaxID=417401 RepID=A0AAN7ZHP1_9COLE
MLSDRIKQQFQGTCGWKISTLNKICKSEKYSRDECIRVVMLQIHIAEEQIVNVVHTDHPQFENVGRRHDWVQGKYHQYFTFFLTRIATFIFLYLSVEFSY